MCIRDRYHNALANRPADLQPFLREVEAFAQDVYAPVLFKGRRASAAERQKVLEGLSRYTGISAEYWDKANLRMDEGHFLQELLRSRGTVSYTHLRAHETPEHLVCRLL